MSFTPPIQPAPIRTPLQGLPSPEWVRWFNQIQLATQTVVDNANAISGHTESFTAIAGELTAIESTLRTHTTAITDLGNELAADEARITALEARPPGSITLQTNGTNNGSQARLNLVAGTNVTLTDSGTGNITIAASGGGGSGTVTSVGLSMPAEFSVAGSPISSSGTFTVTKANASANAVYAGPTSGGAAQPAFRALVASDIPNLAESQVTNLTTDLAAKATATRAINTTAPLTGGGDLSADRTLAISNFTGDSGSGGAKGAVPAPAAGDAAAGKFLKADGAWTAPPGSGAQPYDVVCSLVGQPGASATVLLVTFTRTVNFAANFSASKGTVGANPTATATYTVNKNGSSIGTAAISTSGVFTFATTSGAAQSFAAGDRMSVIAPSSQDATLADVAMTFAGTR
jgi:hypothetical protein